MKTKCLVSIVTSTFNEADNISKFFDSYTSSIELLSSDVKEFFDLSFEFVVADNGSNDGTTEIIRQYSLKSLVPITLIKNFVNVGPDRSILNAAVVSKGDLCLLTCSDLQDPADDGVELIRIMLEDWINRGQDRFDSVVAVKSFDTERERFTAFGRQIYYSVSKTMIRNSRALSGFHGFGVYSRTVIVRTNETFCRFGKNLRLSLLYVIQNPSLFRYSQVARTGGKSSYNLLRYFRHAYQLWVSSDAFVSRMSLGLLCICLISSLVFAGWLFLFSSRLSVLVFQFQLIITVFPIYIILVSLSRKLETYSMLDDLDSVSYSVLIRPDDDKE